jgi:1-acyl-sn-glycerol-3-phosphate acyltransferase
MDELFRWDPAVTRQMMSRLAPIMKVWFRPQINGLDTFPTGGALVVSNHSGGMLTPDVVIFASAFYRQFGYDRGVYTLGHDALFAGPLADWMRRIGLIPASHSNAVRALRRITDSLSQDN